MAIWRAWEAFASWLWKADPVEGSPYGALRVRKTRYHGPQVRLPDGTVIQAGSTICEVHLNNRVLAQVAQTGTWYVITALKSELKAVATWAERGGGQDVQALYGESILGRGALRLGFSSFQQKATLANHLKRVYLSGLLQIYSRLGAVRLERGAEGVSMPEDLWMSRAKLLRSYLVH